MSFGCNTTPLDECRVFIDGIEWEIYGEDSGHKFSVTALRSEKCLTNKMKATLNRGSAR